MSIVDHLTGFVSARFLSPEFFIVLGLIPVVVLLYLLKLRRTEIVIASTMLWIKSVEDLTANVPFQRLRKNLLLLIQVLILLLVIVGLARPFVRSEGTGGRNVCLIIDRSASMSVMESGKTRLQMAKEAARQMVDEMRRGDKAMVVSFGDKSDVLCELTDDHRRLRSAIDRIQPSDTRTKLRDVMVLARSLSPDNPDVPSAIPELALVLLSDGKISDMDELGSLAVDMKYLKIGGTSDNAGIVFFSVRTKPQESGGGRQAFVLVHNESERKLSTTVTLSLDGKVMDVAEIEVPSRLNRELAFDLTGRGNGILRADLDHKDALAADNTAWIALRPRAQVKVLLAAKDDSNAAYFLKHALALDPRVDLAAIDPKNYANTGEYDLTIFDNWAPKQLPPGCLVFINAVPPLGGLQGEGRIRNPPILAINSEHPLTRFLNMGAVLINQAIKLRLPDGGRTLISTTGGPLIADVSRKDRLIALVAFDPADSNWPLNLSFPLFMQNLVAWASNVAESAETSVSAGNPLTIMPKPEVGHATVTLPDGTERRAELAPLRPVFFGETQQAGVYRVDRGDESTFYAVNLLDKNESSVTPASSLKIGRGKVAAETGTFTQTKEFWRWAIFFGIFLLTVEWWIYSRRAWM